MSDIENEVLYENPSLDVELLDAVAELFKRHGLDGGDGGRALAAALVVRWEYDNKATDRFMVNTADNAVGLELFLHGASALSSAQLPGE